MSTVLLAGVAVIVWLLFRFLNVHSEPRQPVIRCCDSQFLDNILKIAPILKDPYVPTRLWGFNGHIQTIFISVVGKLKSPWPTGQRIFLTLQDGTTLTYDMFQPDESKFQEDVTIAICPGICNASDSIYIRTFVHLAQSHGYRCVVLNHLGVLKNVPVTGPRVFDYGDLDYQAMINNLVLRYPHTKIISMGFSLGGNIITKYLGDSNQIKPSNIIGGLTIGQGYSGIEHTQELLSWQNLRRFYLYVMTESYKGIIHKHRSTVLSEEVKKRYSLNEREIFSSATLPELDEAYGRKITQFNSLQEYYVLNSSRVYFKDINIPMIYINASDDPIVPQSLLEPVKQLAVEKSKTAYVELTHGGHLGFVEGGFIFPNSVTWMDRTLVALVKCLTLTSKEIDMKSQDVTQ